MEINEEQYQSLLHVIHNTYGYDFTDYASSSVRRRISHFIRQYSIVDTAGLEKALVKDALLFEHFLQSLSVTVTEMFRDPGFFFSLRKNVIPYLATYPVIRVWVAGCATGEEAYSMAILLSEERLLGQSIIYATDINQRSLATASKGIYGLGTMRRYTENYLKAGGTRDFSNYYHAQHGHAMLDKSLGEKIVFSPHNLSTDTCFNEFQLILCRNVLIYFNHKLQDRVITLLHESLSDFGFLGLGDKESLMFSEKRDCFEDIDKKQKIFRKIN